MEFVDLKSQYRDLKGSIDARIQRVLDHAQYIMGPEVRELEQQLAAFTGSRNCISCSSGTDALLLALMAIGVGAGDQVITTPFTFVATVEVIALLGAEPVYVDIDPWTYNLNPQHLEAVITEKTKAILPVSLYGQCADMDTINEIAARHNIAVIEDAAQSFGATYKGRASGNLSTIGCTSFFPSKPLGCYGDGGACFTNDEELANAMRQIRVHGQSRRYHHSRVGINGRMDTLQAAILLAKLEVFPQEIAARQHAAAIYSDALAETTHIPVVALGNTSAWAQYTIETDDRRLMQEALMARGIPTAVHYPLPLHLQPAYARSGQGEGSFPIAEGAASRVLSLPMHPYLSSDDQVNVIDAVRSVLQSCAAPV